MLNMIIHLRIISRCCTEGKYSKIPGVTRDFPNNLYGTIYRCYYRKKKISLGIHDDYVLRILTSPIAK